MTGQTGAILRVQWRMLINFYRRHGQLSFVLSTLFTAIWYGGFAGIAVFFADALANPGSLPLVRRYAGATLFFVFLYWQGMPLLMAHIGGLLDLKKLLPYPIPEHRFYRIEILLRTLVFLEMPIVMLGMTVGLLRNPQLPKWCALAPIVFSVFNIALGAGIRDLLGRLLARKRVREIAILLLILMAALPSFILQRGRRLSIGRLADYFPPALTPWSAAGQAATAQGGWQPWLTLALFAAVAWLFGRWQFHRSLKFDADTERAAESPERRARFDFFWSWPNRIFRDPLAALVEKEIRFLSRVSRFRIVFFMGFSFGLIIWLPMATGRAASGGWMSGNFLSVVAAYALVLLSEVCFYNCFGFDRTAAQIYYLTPVSQSTVLAAKNIAAAFFVVAEVSLVTVACIALQFPVTGRKIAEAACVCALMTLFFLAIGNIGSTRSPRAQNPNEGWKRTGGSKVALFAFLLYPLIGLPIGLAHMARYAFDSESAFFAVIGAGILIAACFYWVSLDSATETLERDRERILTLLSQTDTPAV